MVVSTPFFSTLRRGYPAAKICVLASSLNAEVILNNPDIDDVFILPKNLISKILLLIRLRKMKFSLGFDLNHSIVVHAIYILLVINPRWVGSSHKSSRYGINPAELKLFDFFGVDNNNKNITEIYMGISEVLGIKRLENDSKYKLFITPSQLRYADFVDKSLFNIGLNLSGSKVEREIKHSDCLFLCRNILKEKDNVKIWILVAPIRYESVRSAFHSINMPNVELIKPTSSIMDAAAILSRIDLLITPDTSLVHIASALNINLVAIYPKSPMNYIHWAPTHSSDKFKVIFSNDAKNLNSFPINKLLDAVRTFL
jgi:ADP-heptose:LPS heptosyltransferase